MAKLMIICVSTLCGRRWKMWSRAAVVFTCLLTANCISSQPLNDEPENVKLTRQLDFGECCPCLDQAGLPDGGSRHAFQSLLPRSEDVDDCPCRFRGSDSEGSPSIFFPTATRSFMKSTDEKESKNLLEPEVDLASSVLETLREVTEEEYQDALVRDAARARAAEDSMLRDTIPEESGRNIVTIIVSPRETEGDDVVSDASHVQESRCIHPLGKSLSRIRMPIPNQSNLMNDILRLPKKRPSLLHRNLLDMDNYEGASNVRENVIDQKGQNIQSQTQDVGNSILRKLPIFTHSKQNVLLANYNRDSVCDDLGFASSNLQERFAEKQNPKLKLKSLIPIDNLTDVKKSTPLKNLLKLKDVELILPGKESNNVHLPKWDFKPLFSSNGNKPLNLNDLLKGLKLNFKKDSNVENVDNPIKTEILDSVPNPSSMISKQTNIKNCELEDLQFKPINTVSNVKQDDVKTVDILDTVYSPSTNEPILIIDDESNQGKFESREGVENFQKDCINEYSNDEIQQKSIPEKESNEENESNAESLWSKNEQIENDTEESLGRYNDNSLSNGESIKLPNDLQKNNDSLLSSTNVNAFVTQPKDFLNNNELPLSKTSKHKDFCVEEKSNKGIYEIILSTEKSFPSEVTIPQRMSETLKSIKDNFKQKLEGITPKFRQLNQKKIKIDNNKESKEDLIALRSNFEPNQVSNILDNSGTEIKDEGERKDIISDKMSIADLQKFSNSLLKLSNKLEEQAIVKKQADSSNLHEDKVIFEPTNVSNIHNTEELTETGLDSRNNIIEEENKNSCLSTLNTRKNAADDENEKKLLSKDNPSEMDFGASEPVISTILKNPFTLFKSNRDVIAEPSLSENSPNADISNIFSTLPTLDDITDQLTGIFGTNNGDNIENTSSETNAEATCPNDDTDVLESLMTAEPSTVNTKSRLAPLEDMNLELFQWRPLSDRPDILKSFRTKLKLPKNLELKPMRLQSALANKGGLLGATLSVGPNQKSKSRVATKPTFVDDFTDVLSPIGTLPSFNDLTSKLRENAQSLLNIGRGLIPSTLKPIPSIETLTENLRSRTESIQKNAGSTFKQANPNIFFGDHLPRPKELLERIANAREDLNDKLIGLHHDLNDRLTTLHENVFDQSRFMSSRIPVMKLGERSRNNNVQKVRKHKSKPVKLLTAESRTESIQRNAPGRNNNFDKDVDFEHMNTRIEPDRGILKAYKPLSNIPVPKYIDVPRLEQTISKPPLAFSHRDSNMKRNNPESFIDVEKQSLNPKHQPLLRKEVNPFKDSKFKITFATTTQAPTTPMLKSRWFTPPSSPSFRSSITKEKNGDFLTNLARSRIPKLKSFDANVLPSEVQLSRVPAPTKFPIIEPENEELNSESLKSFRASHLPMRKLIQPTDNFETSTEVDVLAISRSEEDETKEQNEEIMRKPWSAIKWPKKDDKSFLTQVREAIKARKANVEFNKDSGTNRQISNTDMAKSASENTEVAIFDKHLKENVTYKCKMICTRE